MGNECAGQSKVLLVVIMTNDISLVSEFTSFFTIKVSTCTLSTSILMPSFSVPKIVIVGSD